MPSRFSLLVAPAYALLACGVAIGLPHWSSDVTVPIGLVLGALLFLAAALGHLAWMGVRSEEVLQRDMAGLQRRQHALEEEIAQARREARQIRDALQQAGGAARTRRASEPTGGVPPASAGQPDPLSEVRAGIAAGRVDLLLQPIVALPQRQRRYFEAFSRIRAEDGRVLLPQDYVPAAENAGLISAIDNTLLFRCIQLIRRSRQRNGSVSFFCNISRHSLSDPNFFQDLVGFLRQNGDLAPNLVFEMAQRDLDLSDQALTDRMRRLAELGIRFSVDNVTDYSVDAAALAARNVRFLKADIADFRAGQAGSPWEAPLFRLRRNLAAHRIELIVAKVEREQEVVEMLEYDIDFGQGYLFGQPKPGPAAPRESASSLPEPPVAERRG